MLGPEHTATIDGTEVTYQRHLCGMSAGFLHTYLGDFVDFEELVSYVRGRNATEDEVRTKNQGRG